MSFDIEKQTKFDARIERIRRDIGDKTRYIQIKQDEIEELEIALEALLLTKPSSEVTE